MKVHFLDVGQADCILIQEGKNFALIDAGNNADAPQIISYLKNQKVSRLNLVVGTHPHEDHIGSLDAVINAFQIDKVVMPKVTTTTKTFLDVLSAIKNKGLKITSPKPGDVYQLGQAKLTVLAPNNSHYDNLNDYSVVIKLNYGNTSFLFTGDAGAVSETEC